MILTILLLALLRSTAPATAASTATIVFQFENPQLRPAAYSIEVHEDGSGRYKSMPAPPDSATTMSSASADAITTQPVDREIKIGEPLRSQIFTIARSHKFFAINCDAPKMHVAFTGKKTLTYSGADGHGSCTYNYSRDPQLNRAADQLISVAFTLDEGEKITLQHQHSPLALDAELEALVEAQKDGRALEIGNISTQLRAIGDDESVLLRARRRARVLLSSSGTASE